MDFALLGEPCVTRRREDVGDNENYKLLIKPIMALEEKEALASIIYLSWLAKWGYNDLLTV